jgi:hypothetical protein
MHGLWLNDIESLEAISQDDEARQIFLRMAAMSRDGQMGNFLRELAEDDTFLLALEDYLERTQVLH